MRKIIDIHCHSLDDSQVDWARELGYVKIGLIDHRPAVLAERMGKHGDFVAGIGWVPLDKGAEASIAAMEEFRRIGCLGIKACSVPKRYDDLEYYPVWEKAQEYNLPIFFHTGWLDQRVAWQTYPGGGRVMADNHHPITLDKITLDFPALKLVAYHFGGAYVPDTSLLLYNHANIYADSCRKFSRDLFWLQVGGDDSGHRIISKMLFGTDGMATSQTHSEWVQELDSMLEHWKAPQGLKDRIFYKNSLHVLGLDEELKKTAVAAKAAPSQMTAQAAIDRKAAGALLSDFVDIGPGFGSQAKFATDCWIGYDDKALHMAFRCQDNDTANLAQSRGPLEHIWQDDCVEIFLSPGRGRDYFQIILSSSGRACVTRCKRDLRDISQLATATVAPDAWSAGISIPFDTLGCLPRCGDKWSMNICRDKQTLPQETAGWMEVSTTFHDPSSFGYLQFK